MYNPKGQDKNQENPEAAGKTSYGQHEKFLWHAAAATATSLLLLVVVAVVGSSSSSSSNNNNIRLMVEYKYKNNI